MLAFIQNINPTELLLIAVVAILIFGRRLPEVAGQVAGRVQQARRAFNDLKRETGIDEELRQARRNFDSAIHDAKFSAERDPAAPRIQPPSSGGAVGRGAAAPTQDPGAPDPGHANVGSPDAGDGEADSAVPGPGGPDDGRHGGEPVGKPPTTHHGDPLRESLEDKEATTPPPTTPGETSQATDPHA